MSLHWFNPLVWVAYVLFCRDIEFACDEKVISKMSHGEIADYSESLLLLNTHKPSISICPISFAELGVKSRIKSVLKYKKPAVWLIAVAITVCAVTAVLFMTSAKTDGNIEHSVYYTSKFVPSEYKSETYESAAKRFNTYSVNIGNATEYYDVAEYGGTTIRRADTDSYILAKSNPDYCGIGEGVLWNETNSVPEPRLTLSCADSSVDATHLFRYVVGNGESKNASSFGVTYGTENPGNDIVTLSVTDNNSPVKLLFDQTPIKTELTSFGDATAVAYANDSFVPSYGTNEYYVTAYFDGGICCYAFRIIKGDL